MTAALRALQRRGLDDADWIALAHGLCAPVSRELHPVPELHAALCERRDVLAGAVAGIGPAPIDPGELVQRLPAAIGCVEKLLGELAFVLDTPLAVIRDGRAERWIGLRRRRRVALAIGVRPGIQERSVVLLDGDGAPVLVLDPLVQLARPAPGADEELFVLDGGDPRGARLVAWPRQYERHDDALWPWFAAHLLASVEEVGPDVGSQRAPYLGLAPFTAGDAALYCGREREVEAFCNRLRDETLLAVVGPSGAGKSSFVHAGVVPALPEGWRAISVRPGRTPIATLAARLRREGLIQSGDGVPASIARVLYAARAPEAAVSGTATIEAAIGAVATGAPGPLVLVIDQFEELFTACRDRDERERFARELADAADAPDGALRVVITLRDDFLVAAESLAALRDRLARGLRVLATPSAADLRRILVEPARRAGYEFADAALPDEMVAEVAGEAGALALLSFTAARLWELRDRGFRQLTRRAYESLGGVGGALARHAGAVLAAMSHAERALCRDVLRQLVTAEGTRAAMSRAELDEVLGGRGRARSVIDSLIAARLITASESERGDDRIELVHETLIAAWPQLVAWRREDADGARLRDQLRAAARQWNDRGRTRGLLWRGDALLEYQLWRKRAPGALTDVEEAFARDSVADAARSRRRLRLAIGGAFVVLAVGLVVLFELRTAATRAAESAHDRLIDNYEEQGRRALLDGDAQSALMFLDEAYQMGADGAGLRFMLGRALDPVLAEIATLPHGAKLWSVAFTPDGARAITGGNDGALAIWDIATARRLFTAPGHGEGILRAAVSPDGALVACGAGNGVVEVLRVRDGTRIAELRGHAAAIQRVAWFPDGKRLASTSDDGTARLWDLDGSPAIVLHHAGDTPTGLAISPDGSRIATGSIADTNPSPDN
ncbi:MAG TPA: AAA family ATPase, partial [Kofleriaceae bacterium]